MRHIFIALVRIYQKFISPLKKPCCRFIPTCSHYAIEAFEEWGAVAGLGLSIWRILRCNPFCKGGYDPVPKNKWKRSKK
ncbi:MAG: membrane protein insertion efficiency factor YidD [Clostridia bacterium]|nr:membrane protein insertion efficiency factor YidD [Clostridia bacterium]